MILINSATITSFSTVVAIFMMPFNLWLYERNFETESLVIPYYKIIITLSLLTIPVAIGIIFYWKFPKFGPILTKVFKIIIR
jgi:sodium/bile acid cotransporter 2